LVADGLIAEVAQAATNDGVERGASSREQAQAFVFACATRPEQKAADRAGLRSARIGLAAANGVPEGALVSFGLAGALSDELRCGDVLDVVKVVDQAGAVLWEGAPLGVPGARTATILAATAVVDAPAERRLLRERTGADAADLESGALARSGRLAGGVRVVSDTPGRTLHGVCDGARADGRVSWPGLVKAAARAPRGFAQAARDAQHALRVLERAGRALQEEPA
jgi:nucleoside phosphorylase